MSERSQFAAVAKSGAAALVAVAGAAKAQDFDGAYGGISYTKGSGQAVDGNTTYSFDGNGAGAFVGYNHVSDGWLFGAELAFSGASLKAYDGPQLQFTAENMREIKAKVGRVFGRTAVYGVVGSSSMDLILNNNASQGSGGGLALGVGVEAALGEKAFVGAEYLQRDIEGDGTFESLIDDGTEIKTLTLRLGMRF